MQDKDWTTLRPHLAPIWDLLWEPDITEVMVNPDSTVWVERRGAMERLSGIDFPDDRKKVALQNIARQRGMDLNEQHPILDARLPNGARLCATAPPVSPDGYGFSIRLFTRDPFTLRRLVQYGSIPSALQSTLSEAVGRRDNILIVGGTGAGKTSFLNALAGEIDIRERILTLEDTAEIRIPHPHIYRLEARRATQVAAAVPIRDLLRASLRLNPSRILIGELRGPEAYDFLQALNTGHSGSMTTIHANSCAAGLRRLASLALQSNVDLPYASARRDIADTLNLILFIEKSPSGTRSLREILRVRDYDSSTDQFSVSMIYRAADYQPVSMTGVQFLQEDINS